MCSLTNRPHYRVTAIALLLTSLGMLFPTAARGDGDLRVALLQMAPEGADVAANLAKAARFCRKAADKGADIALMPELWSIGYTTFEAGDDTARDAIHAKALTADSDAVQQFAALADKLDLAIGLTYLQTHEPAPRNVLTLFDRHGAEVFTYAKVHTCDFAPLEAATTPGDAFYVADLDTRHGPVSVGAMICYDREHPESARILMVQGAEVVLTPNACNLDELRLDQFKIRAWENAMGVAMANYARPRHNGRSVAYNAAGKELVKARGREGVHIATFDLESLRAQRKESIWGNAYRRPEQYGVLTEPGKAAVWKRDDAREE